MGSRRTARRRRPSQAATMRRAVSRTTTAATQMKKSRGRAGPAVGSAEAQADQREQREKGVDAHLHAHPSAQRD